MSGWRGVEAWTEELTQTQMDAAFAVLAERDRLRLDLEIMRARAESAEARIVSVHLVLEQRLESVSRAPHAITTRSRVTDEEREALLDRAVAEATTDEQRTAAWDVAEAYEDEKRAEADEQQWETEHGETR